MLKLFKIILKVICSRLGNAKVKRVFFVLSTGRCGTRYLANLLALAPQAVVLHEPPPGCESINPAAYDLFVKDKRRFKKIRVSDFELLEKHAHIYKGIEAEVFGDCYNSVYPFGIALYYFFRRENISVKFIHLVRNPVDCSSSILRAEGVHGIGIRKNFGLRAKNISNSTVPAEIAADVWININEVIRYEMDYIEKVAPGTTKLVRVEDLERIDRISSLFEWLDLEKPDIKIIKDTIANRSYEVRHSHQVNLDTLGIPKISEEELDIIRKKTHPYESLYGYEKVYI